MYNFNSLNHHEFEELCCDVATNILKIPVRMFTQGKDGGIDIKDYSHNKEIIVQVKHYNSFSSMYFNLKNIELPKVIKLNPKKYYIMTSLNLTPKNVSDIFKLFSSYMSDESYIIDGIEINDVLKDNVDIVRRNMKLWLHSESMLSLLTNKSIYIDSEQLSDDLINLSKLYVNTSHYDKSIEMLEKSNVLIITGEPASGKTILSKMVVLNHIRNGYKLRYSTSKNIDKIKTAMLSSKEKEIILLDDFLGQTILDINSNNLSELIEFIKLINKLENKKLILNSRIVILNQQKIKNQKFKLYFQAIESNINHIETGVLNKIQKAKILYNHMVYNMLEDKYLQKIINNKNYLKIINHKNYNPRVIEHITSKSFTKTITENNYMDKVIRYLDDPHLIWNDEFITYNNNEKLLIFAIYLEVVVNGNRSVLESQLKDLFYQLIKDSNSDHVSYENIIEKLTDYILVRNLVNSDIYITFINPSFVDYLNGYLKQNIDIQMLLIQYVKRIEGFVYFTKNSSVKNYITNNVIITLPFAENDKINSFYELLFLVTKFEILDKSIEPLIKRELTSYISSATNESNLKHFSIELYLSDFLKEGFLLFYNLYEYFSDPNNIYLAFKKMYYSGLSNFINALYLKFKTNNMLTYTLILCIEENIEKRLDEKLTEITINNSDIEEEDLDDHLISNFYEIINQFDDELTENIMYNFTYDYYEEIENAVRYNDAMYDRYYDAREATEDRSYQNQLANENKYVDEIFSNLKTSDE